MDFLLKENLAYKDGVYHDERGYSVPEIPENTAAKIVDNSFWHKHRSECIARAVQRWYRGNVFVDVGAGYGYNAAKLSNVGYDVTIFEPIAERVAICKNRGINKVVCAFFNSENVKKSSVPAIGLFDVLEHIEHECLFLEEMKEMISDEGLVFIAVPAFNWLWSAKDDLANHYRRYTLKELKKLAKTSGYNVLYSTYFFSLLVVPMLFLKAIPYKTKMVAGDKQDSRSKTIAEVRKAHKPGLLTKILSHLTKFEKALISIRVRIPCGASCLIVLQKADGNI